jgi:hypothetical protein
MRIRCAAQTKAARYELYADAPAWLSSCRQLRAFGFFIVLETQRSQAMHILDRSGVAIRFLF